MTFENDPKTRLVIEKYVTGTTDPLKGVTFLVTESNGQVVGSSNGEYITDENGRIVIEGLEPGVTITAKEIKTLEGYVLDTTPKSIKIKVGEAQTLRFYNQKQGCIVVKKLDKQTGEPLAGVEFQITYSDGSYLDDDYGHLSSKGLYKTDANGEIRISGVVGTLVITETKPLPGYVMDEGTRTQTVKVNPTDTQTITVYNTKIGGLTIIKKDEETGERIKGVQFEIRKLNGEIVGTYTTDQNGVISLPEAEKGWYQVVELKAAKGYQLDDTPHQIEVKDGGTATLEITNRQTGSALIHKVDSLTGEGIYGVTFLLSDAKGNPVGTSNVMLQSFYWRDTLPAAVRLDKVVTGTYNFPGTYKIVYKVNNTGDYRTLADSLSTSRNYTLAASPTALGLAANERVTEIMFVFGQAPRRLQSGGGPHAPLQGRVRPDRREQLCECGRRGRNP